MQRWPGSKGIYARRFHRARDQAAASPGQSVAGAHYHLKQLVSVGLVELIERRETSGIVEKYYRAVARRFHLDKTVAYDPDGHAASRNAQHVQVRSAVAAFEQHVQAAAEAAPNGALPPDVVCNVRDLHMPPARYERFLARLRAL